MVYLWIGFSSASKGLKNQKTLFFYLFTSISTFPSYAFFYPSPDPSPYPSSSHHPLISYNSSLPIVKKQIIINQLLKLNNPKKPRQMIVQQNEPEGMDPQLVEYLAQNGVSFDEGNLWARMLGLYGEKDELIKVLQGQITKYKAEQAKNGKLISQLQEKIVQLCPNNNNTGSSFMMASEFKDFFEDFMKNCLPACLSPLLSYPEAYVKYSNLIFASTYEQINGHIDYKLNQICTILQLDQSPSNISLIRTSILKILQDNSQTLLSSSPLSGPKSQFENQEIQQIQQSQEIKQLNQKLVKICGYMVLQQRKWNFILPADKRIEKFVKKDFVCIDGWIKEKDEVIVVLEGLAKEAEDGGIVRHPNLKNYVLPYCVSDQEEYVLVPKKCNPELWSLPTFMPSGRVDQECQYSPRELTPIITNKEMKIKKQSFSKGKQDKQNELPSNYSTDCLMEIKNDSNCSNLTKNRSMLSHKDEKECRIETAIRKLSKAEQKYHEGIPDTESLSVLVPLAQLIAKKHEYDIENNLSIAANKSVKLKHSSKTNHNLISDPSFEQILSLPQRKKQMAEQMPLRRQSSRTKKSNSRKTSAGKIVGQAIESKQNMNKNNKEHTLKQKQKQCNKEAAYKEMIKQKLGSEHHKTERQRPKQSKGKHKEEDRPLRIMHFKKIREKYLNL